MAMSLTSEARMIKGVGPQRAELLAERGIYTVGDLLGYLPFRYEDRVQFSQVKDIQPNGTYTIRARVIGGQAIRNRLWQRSPRHVVRTRPAGCCLASFFMAAISKDGLRPASF